MKTDEEKIEELKLEIESLKNELFIKNEALYAIIEVLSYCQLNSVMAMKPGEKVAIRKPERNK